MNDAYTLRNESIRDNCIAHIRLLPLGMRVLIREEKRTDAQSDKMHAQCGDIARQVPVWCGVPMNLGRWKRFAIAAALNATIVPGCDDQGQPGNSFVALSKSSTDLSKRDMGLVIDWLDWFGAMHDVKWSDPKSVVARMEEEHGPGQEDRDQAGRGSPQRIGQGDDGEGHQG